MTLEVAMSMNKKPAKLGEAGSALWDGVMAEHDLRSDELRVLADAARHADLVERMQAMVLAPGFQMMMGGSRGQDRVHPVIAELRASRVALAQLLRQLKLYDDSPEARSTAARAAVNVRWQNRKSA